MLSTTAAPSIGVTMYQNFATGRLLCETHHALACGFVCTHGSFQTLNADGCHVCEAWAKIDRAVDEQTARLVANLRSLGNAVHR